MNKTTHLLALLVLSSTSALAQVTPGGTYTIEGDFLRTINSVQKLDLDPQSIDTVLPVEPMQYTMLPVKADVPARVDSSSGSPGPAPTMVTVPGR